MAPVSGRIGFLGAGMMAEALAKGFIAAGVSTADSMSCFDVNAARIQVFGGLGIKGHHTNLAVIEDSDIIFVAVKPNYVGAVLQDVKKSSNPGGKLVVSIAAGVNLASLGAAAGDAARLIRVMPNTPCLVGATAAAMALGSNATPADGETVTTLFGAVGKMMTVQESQLDAVTGLSGSGPAYVYMIIEAMADGGVRAGLPRDVAMALASQTVYGSAKMVIETGMHPGALKDQVTSPGGTTIAGVHALEQGGLRGTLMSAVKAAADRATEMSKL
eukprot:CAMPEP_0182862212 /NCGR_PEP_ID=MMETSP0034_2-20130328/5936_1 /TAXON_ID=156128 /ORGANISM="Nephroselmis pyriformis, Strain CCMP717" /LENGTH=272 /DNA_ID=CAMNT_0024994243 /DNA_START=4 /DNA_END=822 /DNA_ORIENTATION=+